MSSDTVRILGYTCIQCVADIGKQPSRRSPSLPADIQLIFAPDKTTPQSGLCHVRHPIWITHWKNIFQLHLVGKHERLLFAQNAGSALDQLVTSSFPVLILFLRGALIFTKSPLHLYFCNMFLQEMWNLCSDTYLLFSQSLLLNLNWTTSVFQFQYQYQYQANITKLMAFIVALSGWKRNFWQISPTTISQHFNTWRKHM